MFKVAEGILGQITPVIMELPIATSTAINVGDAVQLTAGKVVQGAASTKIVGVAAVNHGATKDMFNQYSGTDKIVVYCDPNQIFAVPAFKLKASGGSATTITFATSENGTIADDDLNGATIEEASGNLAVVSDTTHGTSTSAGTETLTFASGALKSTPADDDYFYLYPQLGACKGKLEATSGKYDHINFADSGTAVFAVVKHDYANKLVYVKPILHEFGCKNS